MVRDSNPQKASPSSALGEGLALSCHDLDDLQSSARVDFEPHGKQGRVVVGRFAPTPSGKLHLGNLFSFLVAYLAAKQDGGSCLMRIENLDPARSKQEYIDAVFRDLDALGFEWDNEPVYQSNRTEAYEEAYRLLQEQDLLYPCFCTRADLHSANAPHYGDETVYPGTCRMLNAEQRAIKRARRNPAMRIIVPSQPISFHDIFQGMQTFNLEECSGDFILRRSDGVFAYQLAVVVDDAWMGVTSVIRGCDLITSAPRQIYLQRCLGLATPSYGHIPLIVDSAGKRLAKRDKATDIDYLLNEVGMYPEELLGQLAYATGLTSEKGSVTLDELVKSADMTGLLGKTSIKLQDSLSF